MVRCTRRGDGPRGEGTGIVRRLLAALSAFAVLAVASPVPASADGNSAPVAVDDPGEACGGVGGSYPIPEDWRDWSVLALACAPLLNDSDPDGDPLSVDLVGQPAHGAAQVVPGDPDDWLTYRPDPDYSTPGGDKPGGTWVSDVITYRAFDGQASSNPASYRIWVAPVNDPPAFTPGPDLVEAHVGDGPVSIPWATDISPGPPNEGDQHVSFEVDAPAPDDVFAVKPVIDDAGNLIFTPGTQPWLVSVTVDAKDDGGLEDWGLPASAPYDKPDDTSDPVTFAIAIYPALPAPPVAIDDELTIPEDTPGVVDVIANDTDINGDNLSLAAVGAAGKGTTTRDDVEPWQVDYAPSPDANGADELTYTVSDGDGGTDTGTVHVTITPVNDDPVATDDALTVAQGASGVPMAVLDNDADVDGDTLGVSAAGGASHGSLTVAAGAVAYTPAAGYAGPDGFSYTVSDGAGGQAVASVAVTVVPDAVPPVVDGLGDEIAGGRIGPSSVPVRLSWRGTDTVAGVVRFQLQRQASGGAWRTVALATPASTSIVRSLAIGEPSLFRVRALDGAGNWSAFAAWAPIVPQRRQEGSSAIRWTGTWHRANDVRYSFGHARRATTRGHRATFTFTGRGIGLVSRRSPTAGRAEILIDGAFAATIDLSGSTTYRWLAFRRELATGGRHTIEVHPLGDGRVDIDAFVVLS